MKQLVALIVMALAFTACAPATSTPRSDLATQSQASQTTREIDKYQPQVIFDSAQGVYIVVKDPTTNTVVPRLDWLSSGITYTVTFSRTGYASVTQPLTIPASGSVQVKVPELAKASVPATVLVDLTLYNVNTFYLMIETLSGAPVEDLGAVLPGQYQWVISRGGHLSTPTTFTVSDTSAYRLPLPSVAEFKAAVISGAGAGTASSPAATPSPTGGLCYVSGYTRKNGTVVKGYYRRC